MQEKKEVTSAIENIGDILKRRDTGHVEVLDTLKKLRSMLRIIEEEGGGGGKVVLEEGVMYKLCIYWVLL